MLMWRLYTIFNQFGITQVVSVVASAPNITGYFSNDFATWGGAFYQSGSAASMAASGQGTADTILRLDASRSSSIYGASNTIRPISRRTMFMIRF